MILTLYPFQMHILLGVITTSNKPLDLWECRFFGWGKTKCSDLCKKNIWLLSLIDIQLLQRSEDLLRQECNFFDVVDDEKQGLGGDTEVSSVLSAYKSEGDPAKYEDAYKALHSFIEKSLDPYKVSWSLILAPLIPY